MSGLHTIFLGARDRDRSTAFYPGLLGLPAVPLGPSAVGFQAGVRVISYDTELQDAFMHRCAALV